MTWTSAHGCARCTWPSALETAASTSPCPRHGPCVAPVVLLCVSVRCTMLVRAGAIPRHLRSPQPYGAPTVPLQDYGTLALYHDHGIVTGRCFGGFNLVATSQHGGHFSDKAARALLSSLIDAEYRAYHQPTASPAPATDGHTTVPPVASSQQSGNKRRRASVPLNKQWPELLAEVYRKTQRVAAQSVLMLVMEALELAINSNRVSWWRCVCCDRALAATPGADVRRSR